MDHAVPMPITMRTRPCDERFYQAMGAHAQSSRDADADILDLFGDP